MANFWDWRTSSTVTEAAPTAALGESTLELVELYTEHAMVTGQVDAEGRRLSDILNTNSHLALRDARSVSLLNGIEGTEGAGWTRVNTEEILFAMPPQRTSPRQLRVNRPQHRIRVSIGPFVVVGNAHILPGVKLDPYVLRGRMRFLALTNARVASTTDPAWERIAEVVLLNVRPLTDFSELTVIS